MLNINLPYGKNSIMAKLPEDMVSSVLSSRLEQYEPKKSQEELVLDALQNPIESKRLSELAKGKEKIVIIASDHTRPVPSKIIIPQMMKEIRKGNLNADITILIATGFHRKTTNEELLMKFGNDIMNNEKIVVHDSDDKDMLVDIGTLPSGGKLTINKLAYNADLLVSEGFIEPHFFAGFSGGRKSLMPGVAGRATVMYNHCSCFIDNPNCRAGILEGNPIHNDMVYAAQMAKLSFICNVVINSGKEVVYAVAGDYNEAHKKGCDFLSSLCGVNRVISDIVITTNGGYPLDQNIYQAVKGMTAAEATVKTNGVIIMLAKSDDGHGGEEFYKTFKNEKDIDCISKRIISTLPDDTIADQWQSQIFARILKKATVIYISDVPDNIIHDMHMIPAKDLSEAINMAKAKLKNENAKITVIPDGISVVVR